MVAAHTVWGGSDIDAASWIRCHPNGIKSQEMANSLMMRAVMEATRGASKKAYEDGMALAFQAAMQHWLARAPRPSCLLISIRMRGRHLVIRDYSGRLRR